MTDEEILSMAKRWKDDFQRSHDVRMLAIGYVELSARLAEVEAEREPNGIDLRVVSAAYGWTVHLETGEVHGPTEGDQGFEPTGIRIPLKELREFNGGVVEERGEIVKACPRCRKGLNLALSHGTMFHCPCGYSYAEPAYWQRVKGPSK